MSIQRVAVLSPGDMAHAVGRALGVGGLDVTTCLQGRSERTRVLAENGNIRDLAYGLRAGRRTDGSGL